MKYLDELETFIERNYNLESMNIEEVTATMGQTLEFMVEFFQEYLNDEKEYELLQEGIDDYEQLELTDQEKLEIMTRGYELIDDYANNMSLYTIEAYIMENQDKFLKDYYYDDFIVDQNVQYIMQHTYWRDIEEEGWDAVYQRHQEEVVEEAMAKALEADVKDMAKDLEDKFYSVYGDVEDEVQIFSEHVSRSKYEMER